MFRLTNSGELRTEGISPTFTREHQPGYWASIRREETI